MSFKDRRAPISDDTLYELSALACDVSWVFDPSTRRFVHLGGHPEELLGDLLRGETQVPEALAQRVHPEDLQVLRDGVLRSAFEGAVRFTRPDGAVRWLELRLRERSSLLYGVAKDVTDQRQVERTLQALQEATARATGESWLRELVRCLSGTLGVKTVFVGELVSTTRVRTLTCWSDGAFVAEPFEYELTGTPCERVARGAFELIPSGVRARYPANAYFERRGIESYLGLAVSASSGEALGVLVAMHDKPVVGPEPRMTQLLHLLATHAGAELERTRAERELRASEQRLRTMVEAAAR